MWKNILTIFCYFCKTLYNKTMKRKIHFINIGCKVNFAETSRLKKMFAMLDYEITSSPQKTVGDISDSATNTDIQIILLNTCTVTNHSDATSRQIIRKMRKNNPDAFIGVFGCYAQLKPSEILDTTGANAVFGINEKFQIPYIIDELIAGNNHMVNRHSALDAESHNTSDDAMTETVRANNYSPLQIKQNFVSKIDNSKFDFAFSSDADSRTRAFMKLQDGCDYCCSYCVVPLARGNSRSIDFQNILPQIIELEKSGYKEIVISGINLSDYKSASGENFISLIKFISRLDFAIRFRISSIEPQVITEELVNLIAKSPNICPHFHIPLQSGSDAILRLMKRRYNTTQFRKTIELINNFLPNAFIGLDLISGFPSETEENFLETKNFVNSLKISALHCFTFSKRAGTLAAQMKNQIPKTVKKIRTNEMLQISKEKHKIFLANNIGNILTFLPEKYFPEDGISIGHTENYITVKIETNKKLSNNFYKIKMVSAERGEIV